MIKRMVKGERANGFYANVVVPDGGSGGQAADIVI